MRPAIINKVVPLVISDNFKLVKRTLLVEQDIDYTNQIREQREDRKGKQKVRESSQRRPQNQQKRQYA